MTYVLEDASRLTQKKKYLRGDSPDVKSRMLPLSSYIVLARRMIGAFAPEQYKGVMLNSDDAVGFVASKIMRGDWAYEPGRRSKSGRPVTLKTYRGSCGKWAIREYIRLLQARDRPVAIVSDDGTTIETNIHHPLSLDASEGTEHTGNLGESIPDFRVPPVEERIEAEERRRVIRNILASLTSQQRECVILHYIHGMTCRQISERLDISRQAVQTHISKGMKALKRAVGVPT